jgi:ferredoxin
MGTIRFVAPGFSQTIRLDAAQRAGRTLLAIARDCGIPILFNCEAGGCGACIVRVAVRGEDPDPDLSFEETFFLQAIGKLRDGLEAAASDGRRRFRLACQYRVGEEDITVDFTNEIGSV